MFVRVRSLVAAVGLVLVVAGPAAAIEAEDLAGTYTVKGHDGGGDYEATVEVKHQLGHVVVITYNSGQKNWVGLGKLEGNVLRVTWERAKPVAPSEVMNYKVSDQGKITFKMMKNMEDWSKK